MLISIAVLAVMVVDLRRFIFVKNISAFSIDSPLAFILFVAGALAVFIVLNGIQEWNWLKSQGSKGDDTRKTTMPCCGSRSSWRRSFCMPFLFNSFIFC